MSRVPGWLGRLGAGLTEIGERLDERRAEVERDGGVLDEPKPEPRTKPTAPDTAPDPESYAAPRPVRRRPRPPVPRTDPAHAVPWGVRVAAEAGWRLLVLAGTVWILMRVISAVQLVVFAFVIGLLLTALLEPAVAALKRRGVPRGLATTLTAVLGFVVIGLLGWFVTWQVMENIDDLSNQIQSGIDDLRRWLLDSPFHVTDKQINAIAKNLREAVGSNADEITSAGLEGVTVIVELLTGILLAAFSTLFLLYDGRRIWEWTLKLVPAAAREGVAGAGPRAWATLTAYVRGTVVVALIDAIFIGLGIYFLDVPMAVPLAVFIFLFSFIPLVGAVASGALAVLVALVTQGPFTAVMTLAVVLAVQQIEGHILQPFILGRAVSVHPLAVVLSVAAGGMVAGIGGAVVAVPLVAVTNTVVGYLRRYASEQAELEAEFEDDDGVIPAGPPQAPPSP
ncbi:AI-2E family transporter [Streptomyces acidiscabies]|uniref:AI-2E family transporter n=1 Tax=Streptomyces acidiscabies TaxID=42234 RepID=A0AAP6BJY5_9ACTN|nr:AI-2E family transporter [Streptomyces acidiscabies]MBP5937217.1 AI-2E family transporter [Streptomyces sp. LBUM 1476]MBZ3914730.1 AI-2E family transporter [Streptomyces acidiscabies]MDX2966117.1 AI-2E family transporter [Streptomyces acidiscabies]MDX3020644.1 AI-2E family transporter [Streptomyces acidiscabies]MDX3795851.1 AI-2E family transporter [Streptomyces acidiscabies]